MIEAYTLESLLKKYGIDATKVINKNNNILEYGEYQDIDKTLNYLVKELHINARNIEKCPSIMYKAVNNIKENYEFLITTKINTGNIETTLHILNTNPKNLKETYNYVLNNYGIEYINRITSILSTSIDRIKQIEGLFNDKSLVISAAISRNSMDEIKRIIKVCNKNNIPITSSVFKKTSEEIERIIKVCRENNIPITGSVFHKTAEEIEKIIEVCRKNNIPITSSVFHKTAEDIEKIIKPIGTYKKKAVFIKEIATKLINDNIKVIPNDREYLSSFPGVGRKTINVFLSVIYNEPLVAVDTHVNRVSKRLKLAKDGDDVLEVEKKLMKKIPKDKWNKVHHQLVFFGRYKCKSISPLCTDCKLKDICKYYSVHSKPRS